MQPLPPREPSSVADMMGRLSRHWGEGRWELAFGTPDDVANWHIYVFEYLDDLNWMPPAHEILKGWLLADDLLTAVAARCREKGWDGDGIFQAMWLPPFLDVGLPDLGCYVLVVKQDDDGTAWIASPIPLRWFEEPAGAIVGEFGSVPFSTSNHDLDPTYERFRAAAPASGRIRSGEEMGWTG